MSHPTGSQKGSSHSREEREAPIIHGMGWDPGWVTSDAFTRLVPLWRHVYPGGQNPRYPISLGIHPTKVRMIINPEVRFLDSLLFHFSLEWSGGRKFEERVAPLASSLFSRHPNEYMQLSMSHSGAVILGFQDPIMSVDLIFFCAHLPYHTCCLEATCTPKTFSQVSGQHTIRGRVDPHSSSWALFRDGDSRRSLL